jgi:hypothetical protein
MIRLKKHHCYKHWFSWTNFYQVWQKMKRRCENEDDQAYNDYGWRWILVSSQWQEFATFKKDMYELYITHISKNKKAQTMLERIDNNKWYSKQNCKWATNAEQSRNIRTNRILEWNGVKKCLVDWAKHFWIKRSTLAQRYYVYKWDLEKCFTYNLT